MRLTLTKNTITTFLVGLVLVLNCQYYFSSGSQDFYLSKKQISKSTNDNFNTSQDIADIVDEDEASETELSADIFTLNFCYNNFKAVSGSSLGRFLVLIASFMFFLMF